MSRIRINHLPGDEGWSDIGPAFPRRTSRAYANVPAEVVGNMRPIIKAGSLIAISPTGGATDKWADKTWMRTQNAEQVARYRARKKAS